jgi:hypothetical protein
MNLGNMTKGSSLKDESSAGAPSSSDESGSYSKMATGRAREEAANSAVMNDTDAAGMERLQYPPRPVTCFWE